MLRIDHKWSEYHNETFATKSPTVQHDVQAAIGSHSDPCRPPRNSDIKYTINSNYCTVWFFDLHLGVDETYTLYLFVRIGSIVINYHLN